MILAGLFVLTVNNLFCSADSRIRTYNMEEDCGTTINMILDSVYQIRLQLDDNYLDTLQSAGSATCQTNVEPWYTWPNLMFYFEDLDLDCRLGYLQFFQSTTNATRVKGLEDDICGDQKPEGVFTLGQERNLRIGYVARRSQYVEGVFSIIITAYADEPCPVHSFKCDNSRCIDREVRCEGYDSCGDGSGCRFDLSSAAIAAIIISSLVGLFVLISTVICVVCCMRKNRKSQETVQNRTQPRVVYTATTSSTGIISPPAYDSGQSDQIRMNGENPFHPEPYHSASPSSLPPLNVAAGQDPAYPPNWTMPSYQQNVFRNPPPYEEMQTNLPESNDSTEREHENTDNDMLENITNIASSGETDNKTVEEPTDNISVMEPPGGQVREITTNSEETEESPGNSEHEDNTLHETSHVADELESDEEDNKVKNDIIGSGNSLWEGHDKDTKVEGDNYNSKCSKLEMKNNDKTDTFEDAETESAMNIATERNSTP